ncbi:MAG TPA: hypothetical protein DEA89_02670 [Candidatus Moranbacteria bacterium]|nr:hypothetical protein [Candidatus Moranbacteria bacterium]HBI50719.1 hypothetical protein [Candidatus Moranbacteria bacterium]HBU10792.1 hypothetical protein [Candidatus Moranbacteria bacterium]HCO99765.1 hypothetical protein [Candidatus Moranbacteria bacterium]
MIKCQKGWAKFWIPDQVRNDKRKYKFFAVQIMDRKVKTCYNRYIEYKNGRESPFSFFKTKKPS